MLGVFPLALFFQTFFCKPFFVFLVLRVGVFSPDIRSFCYRSALFLDFPIVSSKNREKQGEKILKSVACKKKISRTLGILPSREMRT